MTPRPPITFLGLRMHPWTMDETREEIGRRIAAHRFTRHAVVNVAKVVKAQSDGDLRKALEACDIINIDGMGVVWGARLLGQAVPERVTGIDLFHELLGLAVEGRLPVFLLGARPEILDRARRRLLERFPELQIAGWHHGYFWDDEEGVVRQIAASGARMLFVAITSPAKERFIHRWGDALGVDFVMGVGGTFDVVAGATRRAPPWMQRWGLEWLYRLLQEPRRLGRRYLQTNLRYAGLLLRAWWRGRSP